MLDNNIFYKNESLFVFAYFTVIFFFGFLIVEDYGVTLDDFIYYVNAENTYIYVKQLFLSLFDENIKLSEYRKSLKEFPIVYELLLVIICKSLNLNEFNDIYLTAHRINFLIFFSSLIIFYKLIKKRFDSTAFSILAVTFLILSPRIFAESFYNSRDIFFMCLFIFYLNSLLNYLVYKSFKNILIFSFFTALLINTKILGLIPVGIFSLFYIYNFINTKKDFLNEKNNLIIFFISCFVFIYILWPYLWDNPFENLFLALRDMLKTHENQIVINYYFGQYISSDMMPWHYRVIWFLITTPVIILFLFFIGLIKFGKKIIGLINLSLDKEFKINNRDFFDFLLFIIFISSFFVVIEFNKSKFGGWRHIYYLYPIVIYFSIHCLKFLKVNKYKFFNIIIFICISLNLSYNFYWSVINHPHQYVFFNFLSKNYASKNFDLDWWGVSHKSSIEYILNESDKNKVKIYAEGFTSLKNTYLYLNKEAKKRVDLTDYKNAEYVIDNKMKRVRSNNNIEHDVNFKLIYDLVVNDQIISSIYKKNK